jgi:hypothetical protein
MAMIDLAYYLLPTAAIAAFLASVALRAPRRVGVKVLCIAGLAGFLPLTMAGFGDLLGRPKPVALLQDIVGRPDATVIAATMEEGEMIWLWVAFELSAEPRAFALPWDLELAKQLRKAQADGERQGSKVKMRLTRLKDKPESRAEPMFHAPPPPPLPAKTAEAG